MPERCLPQGQMQTCPCSKDLVNQSLRVSVLGALPYLSPKKETGGVFLGFHTGFHTFCLLWASPESWEGNNGITMKK